jgi:hypothetical protein
MVAHTTMDTTPTLQEGLELEGLHFYSGCKIFPIFLKRCKLILVIYNIFKLFLEIEKTFFVKLINIKICIEFFRQYICEDAYEFTIIVLHSPNMVLPILKFKLTMNMYKAY